MSVNRAIWVLTKFHSREGICKALIGAYERGPAVFNLTCFMLPNFARFVAYFLENRIHGYFSNRQPNQWLPNIRWSPWPPEDDDGEMLAED